LTNGDTTKIPQLVFICGGDLLESFSVPDLWSSDDVRKS